MIWPFVIEPGDSAVDCPRCVPISTWLMINCRNTRPPQRQCLDSMLLCLLLVLVLAPVIVRGFIFGLKLATNSRNWDKSGIFNLSFHLLSPRFVLIGANLARLEAESDISDNIVCVSRLFYLPGISNLSSKFGQIGS